MPASSFCSSYTSVPVRMLSGAARKYRYMCTTSSFGVRMSFTGRASSLSAGSASTQRRPTPWRMRVMFHMRSSVDFFMAGLLCERCVAVAPGWTGAEPGEHGARDGRASMGSGPDKRRGPAL
jgi:hypothetical protein